MPCLTNAGPLNKLILTIAPRLPQPRVTLSPSSDQVTIIQAIHDLRDELIAKIDQRAEAQSTELRTQIEVLQSEFKKANELAEARSAALEGRVAHLETAAS